MQACVLSRGWFSMAGRYVTVMGFGVVVDYATFLLLYSFTGIPVAQFSARLAGAATGFFGHKGFTFRHRNWQMGRTAWQLILFALLWVANYVISTWGIITVSDHFDIAAPVAKLGVEILLAPVSFILIRQVVFRPRSTSVQTE